MAEAALISESQEVINGEKSAVSGIRTKRKADSAHLLQFLAGHSEKKKKSPDVLRSFRPGTPPHHVKANCRT
ncbi:hypothetical protein TNCV_81561 [Trichonephila clavipes]|nr:hypothetical protein TNCV_81561 [Trichonephila clavipes]